MLEYKSFSAWQCVRRICNLDSQIYLFGWQIHVHLGCLQKYLSIQLYESSVLNPISGKLFAHLVGSYIQPALSTTQTLTVFDSAALQS